MNQSGIANTILRKLYEAKFGTEGTANMHEICDEGGWDKNTFWKIADRLFNDGLIRGWAVGGSYMITSYGVISAEERNIAPEELTRINQRARILTLDALARIYEEKGSHSYAHYEHLSGVTGITTGVLVHNLQVLEDLGHVESIGSGCFKITYNGLDAVEEWRQQLAIAEEFERISEMKPHPRGRALQKLFARIVEQHGWSQEEGVRTSHEEMDVIIYREREYYLVECKWEKDPVEAGVIRELHGKLSNRADMRGVVVSMSGLTKGSVEQVESYVGDRVILLFGPKDVRSMVFEQVAFDELLNEKYKALVTRRRVLFD